MKISLICIGKTDDKNLEILIDGYKARISKFIDFNIEYIQTPKSYNKFKSAELKKAEGELLLSKVKNVDYLVLLDEKGKTYTSVEFSDQIQKFMNMGIRHLAFVVGGAFGFSEQVYQQAKGKISMSKMTTTHQLIRLVFTEQVYRAFTILNNHPYHND